MPISNLNSFFCYEERIVHLFNYFDCITSLRHSFMEEEKIHFAPQAENVQYRKCRPASGVGSIIQGGQQPGKVGIFTPGKKPGILQDFQELTRNFKKTKRIWLYYVFFIL